MALLANENARIQEKCSILWKTERKQRDAALKALLEHHELISLKTSGWEGNYQDCGVPLMHRSCCSHTRCLSLQPPCWAARDPWGAKCFTPSHCWNRSWAEGVAPAEGDVPKLMLGSHMDGAGEHLEIASLEQEYFLFTASVGIHGWGITDLHWAAVLSCAAADISPVSQRRIFLFSHQGWRL